MLSMAVSFQYFKYRKSFKDILKDEKVLDEARKQEAMHASKMSKVQKQVTVPTYYLFVHVLIFCCLSYYHLIGKPNPHKQIYRDVANTVSRYMYLPNCKSSSFYGTEMMLDCRHTHSLKENTQHDAVILVMTRVVWVLGMICQS